MPYFKSEKERRAFQDAAAKVEFSSAFEDLLAVAAYDKEKERQAYRALRAAQEGSRLSFQATLQEAGGPQPHTPESAAFWKRWYETVGR